MSNLNQLIRDNLPAPEASATKPAMCLGCYHVWLPIKAAPKKCPACRNYDWDKPRTLPKRKKDAKLNMSPRVTALISSLLQEEG